MEDNKKSKMKTGCLGAVILIVLFMIVASCMSGGDKTTGSSPSQNTVTDSTSKSQDKVKEEKGKDEKVKEEKPIKWNTKDVDALKNGNAKIAVNLLKKNEDIKSIAEQADPQTVLKRPWDYYGKVIAFTGRISDIGDNPPGSDEAKAMGGSSYEIVVMMDNDTTVQGLMMGSSGSMQVGQQVTIYGYPVGTIQGSNRFGGSPTFIMIIGK